MAKYDSREYYITERMAPWLENFADDLAKTNNDKPEKNANTLTNILDIVNGNKKSALEQKIEHYRQLVGLDQLANLAKEGNNETDGKEASPKQSTRIPLSLRDKVAQDKIQDKAQDSKEQQMVMDKITQFVSQVIQNRNGAIATPAILEQLENYLDIKDEWLREHYDDVEKIIQAAKSNFKPQQYKDLQVKELARTDEPNKDKEAPPIWQPPSSK